MSTARAPDVLSLRIASRFAVYLVALVSWDKICVFVDPAKVSPPSADWVDFICIARAQARSAERSNKWRNLEPSATTVELECDHPLQILLHILHRYRLGLILFPSGRGTLELPAHHQQPP